jgi:predicted GTPase
MGNDAINHRLQSDTEDIQTVRVVHPKNGHSVVFVDTPGFDDTYNSDTDILAKIAEWLVKT